MMSWNTLQKWLLNTRATIFLMAQQSLLGRSRLIIGASKSHSETPHNAGLFCASNRPVAETSTWQHTTPTSDKYPCHRRDSKAQIQKASDSRATPYTVWSLQSHFIIIIIIIINLSNDRSKASSKTIPPHSAI